MHSLLYLASSPMLFQSFPALLRSQLDMAIVPNFASKPQLHLLQALQRQKYSTAFKAMIEHKLVGLLIYSFL